MAPFLIVTNQRPGGRLTRCLISGAISPIARIYRPRNQGAEKEIAPLTAISSDPLVKVLLHVPAILNSAGLEVLIPEGDYACQEPQQIFH